MLDEKAKELGRTIGQSTEYQALKRSNDLLTEDTEASTVLRRLTQLRGQPNSTLFPRRALVPLGDDGNRPLSWPSDE